MASLLGDGRTVAERAAAEAANQKGYADAVHKREIASGKQAAAAHARKGLEAARKAFIDGEDVPPNQLDDC